MIIRNYKGKKKSIVFIPIFDFTMLLGEIVSAYGNKDCLKNGKPDALKVNPTILMDTGY